jgi:hypothetical protein
MKSFRSIVSLILALLVLVSSTSFMVGMHLCSGEVQNVALFSKAQPCEKEMKMPPCHRHQTSSCCDDETIVHEGEDFNTVSSEVSIPPVSFITIAPPVIMLSEIIPFHYISEAKLSNYDTPLRACDRTVAHQVFLI